jgi:hypothetical protein
MLEGITKALTRRLLKGEPRVKELARFPSAHHGFVKRLGSGEASRERAEEMTPLQARPRVRH